MRLVVLVAVAAGCGRVHFTDLDANVATPMHVQTVAPNYVTTPSLTEMITVEAGHTIVAATYWDTTPNTITVSDSSGLTWTALAKLENFACFTAPKASGAQLWFAETTSAGTISVTVTQSDMMGRPLGMRLIEYAGLAAYEDSSATLAPSASNAMSAGTILTSAPSVTIALFNNTNGSGTMTSGDGWTLRSIETPFYILVEDNVPGAQAGQVTATAALPAGVSEACWVGTAVAFRLGS